LNPPLDSLNKKGKQMNSTGFWN